MELLIYKASAGSGKTFTLAVQYIKHLLLNPRAYRQILAVTFTNKATTEMKERILTHLYGISIGHPDSEAYLHVVRTMLPTPLSDKEIRHRAGEALSNLIHDYSRFRVETIDSFFQSVMRNLSRELELTPGLTIELDSGRVMEDAVKSMMQKLTPQSPVLRWILDYIGERIEQNRRWNITNEVESFGRNIFQEEYIERGEKLRLCLATPDYVRNYKEQLLTMQAGDLEEMKRFANRFLEILDNHNLSVSDLKRGTTGVAGYFRKIGEGTLSNVTNASMNNCLAKASEWVVKTSKRRDEIIQLAEEELMPLLKETEERRQQVEKEVNSCRLTLQHLGALQLLNCLADEVHTLNAEQNRFLLADTTALLHRLTAAGDASFIYEKMGATLHNVMIDEFQDTSRMQWDNFRLLLNEGLSQGADSLIVGDVKQSIYRWRNGDWNILNDLKDNRQNRAESGLPYTIHVETLNTNRRSLSQIIRFNNGLFPLIVEGLNRRNIEQSGQPSTNLRQAYADVMQQSPSQKEEGYVEVNLFAPTEEEAELSYNEWTLKRVKRSIERLMAQGIEPDEIALLVRKNRMIPMLAQYIDQEMGLPVVSDEAFRLDASPAILLIIDALRYLANESDEVVLRSLAIQYQTLVVPTLEKQAEGAKPDFEKLTRSDAAHLLPATFMTDRDHLRMMPLYELVEALYTLFDLRGIPQQDAYLFAFFDSINEYLMSHSSDPLEFLSYWDEQLAGKTIAAGSLHGIRICSIHKSKGLEFKHVIIPFTDWRLENETYDQLVWCSPGEEPFNLLPLVPITYGTLMNQSVYTADYQNEKQQLWVDSLNLLYVALTRARQSLIIYSQGKSGTIGELLVEALAQLADMEIGSLDSGSTSYALGQIETIQPQKAKASQAKRILPTTVNRLSVAPLPIKVAMESLTHEVEFRQSNRSANFLSGGDEAHSYTRFIDRGLMLHALFQSITKPADADTAISRLLFEGVISADEESELRQFVAHALAHPQVQGWYDGSWRLYNECQILWMENDQLHTRRPDRVMMRGEEIIVIDFKFGKPRPSHHKQVKGYLELLRRMGYPAQAMRGYLWYVDADQIEEIH